MDYESDIFAVKDHEEGEHHFSLAFKDTVGLGADDIPCEEVFIQTFTKLLHNVEAVNGFILVLKMAPITEAFAQKDLQFMRNMMSLFKAEVRRNVLIVVTHSNDVSDETKQRFTKNLHKNLNKTAFDGELSKDNIVHCNFANWTELRARSADDFEAQHFAEWTKMQKKLREFSTPINPMQFLVDRVVGLHEKISEDISNLTRSEWVVEGPPQHAVAATVLPGALAALCGAALHNRFWWIRWWLAREAVRFGVVAGWADAYRWAQPPYAFIFADSLPLITHQSRLRSSAVNTGAGVDGDSPRDEQGRTFASSD
jgi:hypothetical protein